jgi:hypothetical protein
MNIIPPYKYDTPTNLIEKQGDMYRAITDHNPNRSLFLRILIIFFSLFILIFPGLFCLFIAIYVLVDFEIWNLFPFFLNILIGLPLTIGGIKAIYNNIKK